MKLIVHNMYVYLFQFDSLRKFSNFMKEQGNIKSIPLGESSGAYHYAYVFHGSLSQKKKALISFLSDEDNPNNVELLIWPEENVFIVYTGRALFFLKGLNNVIDSVDLLCPLVGLHIFDDKYLLVLEEAGFKLVNSAGEVLKDEHVDFINDFELKDGYLKLNTEGGTRIFNLQF